MPKLQNVVMRELAGACSAPLFAAGGDWIYKNTSPDSKLRHCFVDKFAFEVGSEQWMDLIKD